MASEVRMMDSDTSTNARRRVGRWVSVGVVIAAVSVGLMVLHRTNNYPRTDDAEVFANYIGIGGEHVNQRVGDDQ